MECVVKVVGDDFDEICNIKLLIGGVDGDEAHSLRSCHTRRI